MNAPAPRRLIRPGTLIIYGVLGLFGVITLLPFLWMLCAALKTKEEFFASQFLPHGHGLFGVAWDQLTLVQFKRLFTELALPRALLNSIFLASVGSVVATLFCAMGGYGLSKFRFRGRETLTFTILGTVVLPVALLLSPRFETLFHLGLVNRYLGVFLPAFAPAFGLYLFRQAMLNSVPNDILESARLDGCGEIRIFFQIVLPIVRPMVSAFLIITFIGLWNDYITPQIILQSPELQPLSVAITNLKGLHTDDYGLIMAGTLVSITPVMGLFFLLQREFISGLTSGAVKG
ncbi:MAG: carbohydrate ABC transporter permease [Opitutaceae bacterium]